MHVHEEEGEEDHQQRRRQQTNGHIRKSTVKLFYATMECP